MHLKKADNQLIKGSLNILELFKDIQQHLPPFRVTISPHDSPNRLSDYDIEQASLPKPSNMGWLSAYPPNSLARRKPINLDSPPPLPTTKTFIWDHPRSMDPCNRPDHFYHHGQFLSHRIGPAPQPFLVPEFSYCSTMIHHNIRIPVPYA